MKKTILPSIEGKIIIQQQNVTEKSINIDLSNEGKGIYFLTVTSKEGVSTQKVIVQ